jgi:hypothetical protein
MLWIIPLILLEFLTCAAHPTRDCRRRKHRLPLGVFDADRALSCFRSLFTSIPGHILHQVSCLSFWLMGMNDFLIVVEISRAVAGCISPHCRHADNFVTFSDPSFITNLVWNGSLTYFVACYTASVSYSLNQHQSR